MSIAVSAVIAPSRFIRRLRIVLAMGATLLAIAILMNLGINAPPLKRFVASIVALVAACGLASPIRSNRIVARLHISGHGQIRIGQDIASTSAVSSNSQVLHPSPWTLQPGTLIHPQLLLLRLRHSTGRDKTLLICRDSVSEEAFRRLSVACRWIAAHATRRPRSIVNDVVRK